MKTTCAPVRLTFIYALCEGDVPRYVGKAYDTKRRLIEHIRAAKRGGRTHRDCWIRELLAQGQMPILEIIDLVLESEANTTERFWIAELRSRSYPLVNHTDGGDGVSRGATFSLDARARMSAAHVGHVKTAEWRANIGAAHKGRILPPEQCAKISAARIARGLNRPIPKRGETTSHFKGVSWSKERGEWRSAICIGGKVVALGRFTLEEDAAHAYDTAAVVEFGTLAILNFPERGEAWCETSKEWSPV